MVEPVLEMKKGVGSLMQFMRQKQAQAKGKQGASEDPIVVIEDGSKNGRKKNLKRGIKDITPQNGSQKSDKKPLMLS